MTVPNPLKAGIIAIGAIAEEGVQAAFH